MDNISIPFPGQYNIKDNARKITGQTQSAWSSSQLPVWITESNDYAREEVAGNKALVILAG